MSAWPTYHGCAGRGSTDTLSVDVSFGDRRLRLRAGCGTAAEYRAWIVPSRAGRYAFHISGRLKGEAIDITSACSERRFSV